MLAGQCGGHEQIDSPPAHPCVRAPAAIACTMDLFTLSMQIGWQRTSFKQLEKSTRQGS